MRKVPKYCLHKPSGQGYVYLNHKPVYLGKYNTPENIRQYQRLIARHCADDPERISSRSALLPPSLN